MVWHLFIFVVEYCFTHHTFLPLHTWLLEELSVLQVTYWLVADVVVDVAVVMGIIQDGVMLMCVAEGMGVV